MTTPLRLDSSQREDDDFELYKQLTRDVCYLYHELADYGHIMGDLDYANDYSLPYWEVINGIGTGYGNDRFIRSGILVLFMAMIHDQLDGSGCWLLKHANDVAEQLKHFIPEDENLLRLCDAVLWGITLIQGPASEDEQFATDSAWAYDTFVRSYFQNRAKA